MNDHSLRKSTCFRCLLMSRGFISCAVLALLPVDVSRLVCETSSGFVLIFSAASTVSPWVVHVDPDGLRHPLRHTRIYLIAEQTLTAISLTFV